MLILWYELHYFGRIFRGNRSLTVMSLLNETFSLTQTYFLLLYTNVLNDPEIIFQVGWIVIALIILQILINVLNIVIQSLKDIKSKFKKKKVKHEAPIEKKFEEKEV